MVLGHRRGAIRVWRTPDERFNPTVMRERWNGASEFMFWGSFSYDKKGPFHIWKTETKKEKEAATKELNALNAAAEPEAKAAWELVTAMRRLNLRGGTRGRKPMWKYDKVHGALVREAKRGGIDWYRYQKLILIPKLIPFAKECMVDRPNTMVQEDKAPAHAHKSQNQIFMEAGVMRLLWPGNSPDLNAIEPCWPILKRGTTRRGPPLTGAVAEKVWSKAWKDLEQEKIQAWIERIPEHIERIIELEGGNNYEEGRNKSLPKVRKTRTQAVRL